ncbi:sirohydrochlorin chelatase [Corynebacterium tapiri]|uniref:CMP-binding protein n=1 Tax=Corynebacterium tapiri TaxID=1448266 RepID=A0A5C4U1W9_9CORY|nr:CbiX/SirB N-terminal domain-containing protein [Corynebacterium tapiri]TNL95701.1 CMP-binding protein [Corynebacterium tapiri]
MSSRVPLILLSHGSRHPRALGELEALVEAVAAELDVPVELAHLDFSADTLEAVSRRVAEAGHPQAVVIPLLFSSGYHARHDVPSEVAAIDALDLVLGPSIGVGPDVAEVVAHRARVPGVQRVILFPVGSSRKQAQRDMEELRQQVAQLLSVDVEVVPATGASIPLPDAVQEGDLVVPIFVSEGLLLDKAHRQVSVPIAAPLGRDLAGVVASRYRAALSG